MSHPPPSWRSLKPLIRRERLPGQLVLGKDLALWLDPFLRALEQRGTCDNSVFTHHVLVVVRVRGAVRAVIA